MHTLAPFGEACWPFVLRIATLDASSWSEVGRVDTKFAEFVQDNAASLHSTASLASGTVDSEELLREVFASLYPKWRRVVEADLPVTYVRCALVTCFISRRRSRATVVRPVAWVRDWHDPAEFADPVNAVPDRAVLRDPLARLPPKQRATIVLRYSNGQDEVTIDNALGCRQATVRSLISSGLGTLRAEAATVRITDATGTTEITP